MGKYKDIDEHISKLIIERNIAVEQALTSNSAEDIFKAQKYLQDKSSEKKKDPRAFLFDPYEAYGSTGGYKQSRKRVSFEILKKVGDTPVVGSVINTRVFQIQNFLRYTEDEREEGYTIRKKRSIVDKGEESKEDKKKVEYIVNFLENGGLRSKWDANDGLHDFIRKIMKDSMCYDQISAECERNRRMDLIGFTAIDASTIRILETVDPRFKAVVGDKYEERFGHYPRYAQVFQGNIMTNPIDNKQILYYPWELIYAQRNKTTDYHKNWYGTSEIEILLDIITWSLWGMQYNGNFFKQGSNPKGFINLKEESANMDIVNDFRQTWRQTIAGVNNSHKIPVFSGIDLEWIDLQSNNKDMEFQQWMEFLIIMICSVYTIDPSELGYQFQKQAQVFGQDGQAERLAHSRKKGLKPLLLFLEKVLTKWIVSELDEQYELVFSGIDVEDEVASVDLVKKKLDAGIIPFEFAFEKEMGRKYKEGKDTILSQPFLQVQQQKLMGGMGSNEEVDSMTGEGGQVNNPFQDFADKSVDSPILKEAMKYINDQLRDPLK